MGRHAGWPDEIGKGKEPAPPMSRACAASSKARCCRGSRNRRKELANRPLVREQAFGEALDPDKLERLGRYEVL